MNQEKRTRTQVKICGLTSPQEALACARLGADAIGCIFYPPSPRFVKDDDAVAIRRALPEQIPLVGIFVDEPFKRIMDRVKRCGLAWVQLHGSESPELVIRLEDAGIRVIKTLYAGREPYLKNHLLYPASAFLAEHGGGRLPGGNALTWDWGRARRIAAKRPLILAGGLNPENVASAVLSCLPDAVDVSSGVELGPGRKNLVEVERFVLRIKELNLYHARRLF